MGILLLHQLSLETINPDMPPVFTASAAGIIDSGECGAEGNNITWTLDNDGTLTISGEGKMSDWNYDSPWNERDDIINVLIEDGITNIGDTAFNECKALNLNKDSKRRYKYRNCSIYHFYEKENQ